VTNNAIIGLLTCGRHLFAFYSLTKWKLGHKKFKVTTCATIALFIPGYYLFACTYTAKIEIEVVKRLFLFKHTIIPYFCCASNNCQIYKQIL